MIYFKHSFDSKKRSELVGAYIVEHNATVREAARFFGISKSTVHKDVTTELRTVNLSLYERVRDVLQINKEERHIRGGEATRKKFLHTAPSKANNS